MTYDHPQAWRQGPHLTYRRFASVALDAVDRSFAGLSTVDAGAGTGAMGEELAARGATVVFLDREVAMVRDAPSPRLVGDITSLPLADRCLDLAAAAFVLSHVDRPDIALDELARVTRAGGLIVATAFPAGERHPVKTTVEQTLADAGYRVPDWYQRLKATGEQRVGDPMTLRALARGAGLGAIQIQHLDVTLTSLGPDAVLAWRLGMPAIAAFMARLPAARRAELTALARQALSAELLAQPVRLLALAGEVR